MVCKPGLDCVPFPLSDPKPFIGTSLPGGKPARAGAPTALLLEFEFNWRPPALLVGVPDTSVDVGFLLPTAVGFCCWLLLSM